MLPLFPGSVKFIDYEYAGYNYQAYDIGNHFNEFAGKNMPINAQLSVTKCRVFTVGFIFRPE